MMLFPTNWRQLSFPIFRVCDIKIPAVLIESLSGFRQVSAGVSFSQRFQHAQILFRVGQKTRSVSAVMADVHRSIALRCRGLHGEIKCWHAEI